MPTSTRPTDVKCRRRLGAFYTPPEVVRFMVHSCVTSLTDPGGISALEKLTMLDLACGDGAFLLGAAAEHLESRYALRIEMFGVDVDGRAIEALQGRLDRESSSLATQIVCGDALTGPAFGEDDKGVHNGLDWPRKFPELAAAGGFDVVIGNPPYLREKNAKAVFDRIADTPLGKRWRQPRMDLWHYFLHRGLDLLKPGGVLSFIVNSYWTNATSARRLIARLRNEATIERIVLLGEAPVFAGVSGRHMILQLRKGRGETDCHVLDLTGSADVLEILDRMAITNGNTSTRESALLTEKNDRATAWPPEKRRPPWVGTASGGQAVPGNIGASFVSPGSSGTAVREIPPNSRNAETSVWAQSQSSLYDAGRFIVAPGQSVTQARRGRGTMRLAERFVVRQGIAENPPFVTRSMSDASGGSLRIGAGVFVLTDEEVAALRLTNDERRLLRPYYATASLGRFALPRQPTHWLLYLTRKTAPEISQFPAVHQHLQQFRGSLEQRREVRRGAIAWWHLHWPRREELFTEPRILAVQMGRQPTFVFAERATFVGFSINVVQSVANDSRPTYSLAALTAILNSATASEWFAVHAKRRGVNLDISGTVLQDFPIPTFKRSADTDLTRLCHQRQSSERAEKPSADRQQFESEVDLCVATLFKRKASSPIHAV